MDDGDIVLTDTGAIKMWMARLYPTCEQLTCLISNGLSAMAWALPGVLGAKLARLEQKVLVVRGDGGLRMSSQEIETAVRESIPLVAPTLRTVPPAVRAGSAIELDRDRVVTRPRQRFALRETRLLRPGHPLQPGALSRALPRRRVRTHGCLPIADARTLAAAANDIPPV